MRRVNAGERVMKMMKNVSALVGFVTALTVAAGAEPEREAARITKIELSSEHIQAVNRPRRIYVNNDAGYGAPMGPTISAITPAEWIEARFSAYTQPGSQVDCVGWRLDEGNVAAYPSKVLSELQYPTLLK